MHRNDVLSSFLQESVCLQEHNHTLIAWFAVNNVLDLKLFPNFLDLRSKRRTFLPIDTVIEDI